MTGSVTPSEGWPWSWVARIPGTAWQLATVTTVGALGTVSLIAYWPSDAVHRALAILLLVCQVAPLGWVRRYPLQMWAITGAATFAIYALGLNLGGSDLAVLIATYQVGRRGGPRRWIVFGAAAALTVFLAVAGLARSGWPGGLDKSAAGVILCAGFLIGDNRRVHLAYLAELESRLTRERRDRDEDERRAAEQERVRLARELHDVVVHHVGAIAVQADAFRAVRPNDPAAGSFASLATSARQALAELNQLLGVLRRGGGRAAPRAPQPSIQRVDQLLGQVRAAGLGVHLIVSGRTRPLPAAVDLSAYRVVQEGLTNAVKHAPGSRVEVSVHYGNRDVSVRVADDGPGGEKPELPSAGHGLIGMRERVAVLGGDFSAGPLPGGGFAVSARLPLESPP